MAAAVAFPNDELALVDPARVCRGASSVQHYRRILGDASVGSLLLRPKALGLSEAGHSPPDHR
jgi:hypothetical protein